jgi:transposase
MVYRTVNADIKQRALQLLTLGVSTKSIERWSHNYETQGCVDPPSILQRLPRLLKPEAVEGLRELIQATLSLFLDELNYRYMTISESSV